MKKRANKHFIQINLFFLLLIGLLGVIMKKYAPLFLHTTIYYCQEIIKSFNTYNFPQNSNIVYLIPVGFILILVVTRLTMTIIQLIIISKSLNRQKISNHLSFLHKVIKKTDLENKVLLIRNNQPLALCYGLFRPKIYISTGLLTLTSLSELEVILKHEKHHLQHKDNRTILFAHIIQKTFPLMPILSDLVNNFRIECEIAADVYAAEGGNRHVVSAVLKKLLKNPQPAFAYFPSLAAEDTLQARIESLFLKKNFKSQYLFKNITLSFFSILILLGLIITPIHAIELHAQGKDAIMVCVNNEQCAVQCETSMQEMQNMSSAPNKSTPYSPLQEL